MSRLPSVPERLEWKYSVVPSHDSDGRPSLEGLLTSTPRFTGDDQDVDVLSRVAVHRADPRDPVLFDSKKISSPSRCLTLGRWSSAEVFSSATLVAGPNIPLASKVLT